jgi:hypothetical protein
VGGTTWYGPAKTWPSDPTNAPWITFWHNLDTEINGRLGTATLADDFCATYPTGPISDSVSIIVTTTTDSAKLINIDQRSNARPKGGLGDVGAIEK